ncbi:MAG: rhomboid family intramembrane serine protease [Treponema sp.]|nr:rhomboid family intramembrane serine protease [Treponema sp.]
MTNPLRRPFSYSYCHFTLLLAAVNILVFILTKMRPYMLTYLALNPVNFINHKMWWQLVTCMFTHGGTSHLFWNMFGLLMFGPYVERAIGSKEFSLMYFLCGIINSLFSLGFYLVTGQYNVFLIGASGVIYTILFAFTVIFPSIRIFIFWVIPVPGPVMIIIYTIIAIGSQLLSFNMNIAHMTHLFGFVTAWFYFVIRMGVNPIKVWKNARH